MTLTELTTPLTRAQIEAAIYAALAARGAKTSSWKPGSVVRAIIVGVALVLYALSLLQAQLARAGFLELSKGDWLTLVALYVYGVTRDAGAFATGTVTCNNAGGGVYSGAAGDLIFRNASTGKTYRNTAAFSILALQTGVSVSVEAIELGTESNAAAGEITEFETPLLGVSCTNAAALVGRDVEEDPALRTRCLERTGALSPNGPRDAYAFKAKGTTRADGSSIGVTRTRSIADGQGGVTLYVADADGVVAGGDVTLIQTAIESFVAPLAVTPTVVSATAVTVPVTYQWWLRDSSGLTEAEAEAEVLDRLAAWFAAQPIGGHVKVGSTGKLYVDAIEAVIAGTRPDETVDVSVTLPAAAVDLTVSQVALLGTVTPTVTLVSGGVT